jgi:hypothetical protein
MECSIFYSWQSDLPGNFNRSFIEKALKDAAALLSKDEDFSVTAIIDRNTDGLPGSPSIAHSISDKIARCDLFVCDVSIINSGNEQRPTPNPNVLFELGYASAVLGWDRIVLIQNYAYSGPESLPFDLRGRAVNGYYLNEQSDKPETRKGLEKQMLKVFKEVFAYHSPVGQYNHNKSVWWGTWSLKTRRKAHSGALFIFQVSSTNFFFDLHLTDGARSGKIRGNAMIVAPNAAIAFQSNHEGKMCEVVFRRVYHHDYWIIELEQNRECSSFQGQGTTFTGTYELETESVLYRDALNEVEMNLLASVTGKYCYQLLERFQQISSIATADNFIQKVVSGGCKGMYTIMEGIVALNDKGEIWCAYIDGNVVRYFTSVPQWQHRLPQTLDNWREKFSDKPIVFSDAKEAETLPITGFDEARAKRFSDMKELFLKKEKKWWQIWKS